MAKLLRDNPTGDRSITIHNGVRVFSYSVFGVSLILLVLSYPDLHIPSIDPDKLQTLMGAIAFALLSVVTTLYELQSNSDTSDSRLGDANKGVHEIQKLVEKIGSRLYLEPFNDDDDAVKYLTKQMESAEDLKAVYDIHTRTSESYDKYKPDTYKKLKDALAVFLDKEKRYRKFHLLTGHTTDAAYIEALNTGSSRMRIRRLKHSTPLMNFTLLEYEDHCEVLLGHGSAVCRTEGKKGTPLIDQLEIYFNKVLWESAVEVNHKDLLEPVAQPNGIETVEVWDIPRCRDLLAKSANDAEIEITSTYFIHAAGGNIERLIAGLLKDSNRKIKIIILKPTDGAVIKRRYGGGLVPAMHEGSLEGDLTRQLSAFLALQKQYGKNRIEIRTHLSIPTIMYYRVATTVDGREVSTMLVGFLFAAGLAKDGPMLVITGGKALEVFQDNWNQLWDRGCTRYEDDGTPINDLPPTYYAEDVEKLKAEIRALKGNRGRPDNG